MQCLAMSELTKVTVSEHFLAVTFSRNNYFHDRLFMKTKSKEYLLIHLDIIKALQHVYS